MFVWYILLPATLISRRVKLNNNTKDRFIIKVHIFHFTLTNNLAQMPDTEVIPGATYHLIPFDRPTILWNCEFIH